MDRTDSGVQQSIHEKLEYYRVVVNRKSLIYVPKWIIAIKAGEHTYHRKALAASSTLIVDEIAFCPNHFSLGKIWSARRRTSAVCEICGGAFCNEHIFKTNNMYYCEKHKSAAQEA
jgi:predicted nucleic acid binding AN1-type Zn finger protein